VILVLGFSGFEGVARNPAERLAQELDGRRVAGHTIVGRSMPVSYERSVSMTCGLARQFQPAVVLGIGVATARSFGQFETHGRNEHDPRRPDVDGVTPPRELPGQPKCRNATFPSRGFHQGPGPQFSSNAGNYVCNAWLFGVLGEVSDSRVGFLHIPISGYDKADVIRVLQNDLGPKT